MSLSDLVFLVFLVSSLETLLEFSLSFLVATVIAKVMGVAVSACAIVVKVFARISVQMVSSLPFRYSFNLYLFDTYVNFFTLNSIFWPGAFIIKKHALQY